MEPRPHFASLVESHMNQRNFGVAFLFGSERFGMRNEDVYRCHTCLRIPTDPKFGSLNLGAAVQVLAYDWRQALGGLASMAREDDPVASELPQTPVGSGLADAQQLAGLLAHWQQALTEIGFLDPEAPKKLMPRLNQLFNRAQVTEEEIHILRGIAKAMSQASSKTSGGQR
jgi:tRNA/rRNA methyltransferase